MEGLIYTSLAALLGLVIVYLTIPPLIRVVNAKRLFEPFDKRKVHKNTVPTIGGVSIFIGFMLSSYIASDGVSLHEMKYLYPAVILMFFIGLKDDLLILPAKKKLGVQVAAALMLATLGDFRLPSLYGIFGIWHLGYVPGTLVSAFLILAIVNAFNFIDGIDGLASGVAIIIASAFGACFLLFGQYGLSIISFALVGSLLAFFRYNVFGKKYKLFMGDTGSLIIGTILAGLTLKYIEIAPAGGIALLSKAPPAFAVGVMVVPTIDLMRIFFVRLWNHKSPFSPDSNHIHHRVLKIFPSHLTVTLLFCAANLLFIGLALLLLSTGLNVNYSIGLLLLAGFLTASLPYAAHIHAVKPEIVAQYKGGARSAKKPKSVEAGAYPD